VKNQAATVAERRNGLDAADLDLDAEAFQLQVFEPGRSGAI